MFFVSGTLSFEYLVFRGLAMVFIVLYGYRFVMVMLHFYVGWKIILCCFNCNCCARLALLFCHDTETNQPTSVKAAS